MIKGRASYRCQVLPNAFIQKNLKNSKHHKIKPIDSKLQWLKIFAEDNNQSRVKGKSRLVTLADNSLGKKSEPQIRLKQRNSSRMIASLKNKENIEMLNSVLVDEKTEKVSLYAYYNREFGWKNQTLTKTKRESLFKHTRKLSQEIMKSSKTNFKMNSKLQKKVRSEEENSLVNIKNLLNFELKPWENIDTQNEIEEYEQGVRNLNKYSR